MYLTRAQTVLGAIILACLVIGAYAAADQLRAPQVITERVPVIVYPDPTPVPGVLTPDMEHDISTGTWPVHTDPTEHHA